MTNWGPLAFQDAASSVMLQLISFHDHALLILTLVLTVVVYAILALMINKHVNRYILEAQTVCTILPALTLLILALPSLWILYITDEVSQPSLTVKTIGHQWYWSYEYTDFMNVEMDSYMLPKTELTPGDYRLLEVDNRMVVPMQLEVRLLYCSSCNPFTSCKGMCHPSATKSNLFHNNSTWSILWTMLICGANHSFMPIALEAVNTSPFMKWIKNFN